MMYFYENVLHDCIEEEFSKFNNINTNNKKIDITDKTDLNDLIENKSLLINERISMLTKEKKIYINPTHNKLDDLYNYKINELNIINETLLKLEEYKSLSINNYYTLLINGLISDLNKQKKFISRFLIDIKKDFIIALACAYQNVSYLDIEFVDTEELNVFKGYYLLKLDDKDIICRALKPNESITEKYEESIENNDYIIYVNITLT